MTLKVWALAMGWSFLTKVHERNTGKSSCYSLKWDFSCTKQWQKDPSASTSYKIPSVTSLTQAPQPMVLGYSDWGDTTATLTARCFALYSPQLQLEQAQRGAVRNSRIQSASVRMQSNSFWFSPLQKIAQVWSRLVLPSLSCLFPPCPKRSDRAHRFLHKRGRKSRSTSAYA